MIIDSEEKAKIAVLSAVGTALLCEGRPLMGVVCFVLLLPWGAIGRVGGWLAHPVIVWRKRQAKPQEQAAA